MGERSARAINMSPNQYVSRRHVTANRHCPRRRAGFERPDILVRRRKRHQPNVYSDPVTIRTIIISIRQFQESKIARVTGFINKNRLQSILVATCPNQVERQFRPTILISINRDGLFQSNTARDRRRPILHRRSANKSHMLQHPNVLWR